MGRSYMQGTPWHEEINYPKKKGETGSTRCASNIGGKCTCSVSPFHKLPCGGSNECKEYAYNLDSRNSSLGCH